MKAGFALTEAGPVFYVNRYEIRIYRFDMDIQKPAYYTVYK